MMIRNPYAKKPSSTSKVVVVEKPDNAAAATAAVVMNAPSIIPNPVTGSTTVTTLATAKNGSSTSYRTEHSFPKTSVVKPSLASITKLPPPPPPPPPPPQQASSSNVYPQHQQRPERLSQQQVPPLVPHGNTSIATMTERTAPVIPKYTTLPRKYTTTVDSNVTKINTPILHNFIDLTCTTSHNNTTTTTITTTNDVVLHRPIHNKNNNNIETTKPPVPNLLLHRQPQNSTTTRTIPSSSSSPPPQQVLVRPSSSTSSITTTGSSSQLSQSQLVWNTTGMNHSNSNNNNNNNNHNNSMKRKDEKSDTSAIMLDRYYNTLPPEIRFSSYDKVTQPVQDEYRTNLVKNAALSEPLLNGWTLYSHQKRAILVSLLMRRHILALDMGLGKTVIGCCWARAFVRTIPNLRVIILCPVSLKEEWQRTAQDIAGLSIHCDSDTNPKPRKKAKVRDVTDENSSTTSSSNHNHTLLGDGVVTISSWAKVPHPDDVVLFQMNQNHPYVVVADEAHSMQSMNSARTRDALHLMLSPNAVGVLLLTGTPMKNGKPANLFPLLKAVKHPFGNHQRAYEAHFCGGRDLSNGIGGRPMWVATGAANLDQLRVLTKSHMLHMTKDDVLKELPKQTRIKNTVFVSSRSQMRHNDAMRKLSMIYENRTDPFQQEAILGAVQNMRLVDSFAKVAATVEVAREVLRKEPAVVIFTSFVDVAKSVHQKLSEYGWTGELLTGETPAKKRQGMVDNFQNGLSPVFCCTFGAGGVGLTLTAAATVILLDRPWTPGDVHQAEDRVRRIGQTKPVTSIWMSAFELDKQIDDMIESKSQTSSTVLSEQSTAAAGTSSTNAPKLSILKMIHSFLASQSSSSTATGGYKQAKLPEYGHGSFKTY